MMKQLTRSVRYLLCVMAVVFSLTLPSAAAEQNYYDCLLRVYGCLLYTSDAADE